MAGINDLPLIPAQLPRQAVVITPEDLQPLIDKMAGAYDQGYNSTRQITDTAIVGNSRANAQRQQNQTAQSVSREDQVDAAGVQPTQSVIGKLFGLRPKQAAAPAASAAAPATGGAGLQHLSTDELLNIANGGGYQIN